jgi:Ca2+-binding EF-hand superfamily protein
MFLVHFYNNKTIIALKEHFTKLDTNGSGKITQTEYNAWQDALFYKTTKRSTFQQHDINCLFIVLRKNYNLKLSKCKSHFITGDGGIDFAEYVSMIEKMLASASREEKLKRMFIVCSHFKR